MRKTLVIAIIGWFLSGIAGFAGGHVSLIKINGAIGPATADYISRAVDAAQEDRSECLIIQLDTPGGLLDSTKTIVEKLLASQVPTVVYVAPSGATAASAGCFITLAADFAAMAPTTTIGAAHPVEMGGIGGASGSTDEIMKQKLENYAASYIGTIADKRHHNVSWAQSSVRESASITADQALKLKVIDIIAENVPSLLHQLDGKKVNNNILHTANAEVIEITMSDQEKLFQLLWRPEVMFVLMLAAIYGIIGELSSPGAILPGVIGGIALILALYMSAILPVNISGVALILLAVALFIIDVYAPTHGILTGGGIISFFLGAIMLFRHAGPGYNLSLGLIVPATVTTALFFLFAVGAGLRAQRLPAKTGRESMVGMVVPAQTHIDSNGGKVFVEGEYWNAVSDGVIEEHEAVEIISVEGLTLRVAPKPTIQGQT